MITFSVRSEYSTKNLRRSSLDTLHGRLPIHTPCSDLFSTSDFFFCSSGSGVDSAPDFDGGRGLPFLSRRRSFLEGGSGAVMSTSISSTDALRFFEGGSAVDSSIGGIIEVVRVGSIGSLLLPSVVRVDAFLFLLDLSFFGLEDGSAVGSSTGGMIEVGELTTVGSVLSPSVIMIGAFVFLLDLSFFGLEDGGGVEVVRASTFAARWEPIDTSLGRFVRKTLKVDRDYDCRI